MPHLTGDAVAYLDHAATTALRPEAFAALTEELAQVGNPSSQHSSGRRARRVVEESREAVAAALGVRAGEVVFTSGGTEADNMAVLGAAMVQLAGEGARGGRCHIVSSPTEHKAVLAALKEAEHLGARVTLLPVDRNGVLDMAALDDALAGKLPGGRPTLVSIMWVNNETGVIQPIREIADKCAAADACFHTDAVQALGKLPVNLKDLHCASAVISAHKICGPKGIGAIFARDRKCMKGLVLGGGQQGGIRPGTENVAGAVGFGAAAMLATKEQQEAYCSYKAIRDAIEAGLRERFPDLVVHAAGAERGPNILNVSVPETDSETMLMHLDLAGLACASGSACSTGSVEPSHVLTAMGVPRDLAVAAVRLSVGCLSKIEQVPLVVETFTACVAKVRKLRAVLARA